MPVSPERRGTALAVVDWECLNAALERASYAVSRMSEVLRETVWDRDGAMRWTPPAEGVEVPRWLA